MSDDLSDILGDDTAVHGQLKGVIEMLRSERPAPRAGFRGQLARELRDSPAPRPIRLLWLRVVSLAVAGALMLGVVALGVDHHGPFAPSSPARGVQAQIPSPAIVARAQISQRR